MTCKLCFSKVSSKKITKHQEACQRRIDNEFNLLLAQQKASNKPVSDVVKCPYCNRALLQNKLQKHIDKKCQRFIVRKAANVYKVSSTYNDAEIAAYVKAHPELDKYGSKGLPQDKYRRSAYGRKSMQYDAWRIEN